MKAKVQTRPIEVTGWAGEEFMGNRYMVFFEFFVVLAFGIGWYILDLVIAQGDSRREAERAATAADEERTRLHTQ